MKHDYARARRTSYQRYRCRCRQCDGRRTLTKHPDFYVRLPRCIVCGGKDWRVDWYRTSRIEAKRTTCFCIGRAFPHRRGSEVTEDEAAG